jgi:hypothetical protein
MVDRSVKDRLVFHRLIEAKANRSASTSMDDPMVSNGQVLI